MHYLSAQPERDQNLKRVKVVTIMPERKTNSQLLFVKGIRNILHRIHHTDSPSSSQSKTWQEPEEPASFFSTLLQGIFSASAFSNGSAALTEALNHPDDVIRYSLISIPPKIPPRFVSGNGLLHRVLGPQDNHH